MTQAQTTKINRAGKSLYEKIWDSHLVDEFPDGTSLLYVDRHLIHEVTSPQAFERLREAGRRVRSPELALAVADHNVPTLGERAASMATIDPASSAQIAALERNCRAAGIDYLKYDSPDQGIVHVVGPEQGFVLPGTIVVCGDSHTASHGALGALGIGIGTSEIEHVLATQTLRLRKSGNLEITLSGVLRDGVSTKDVALKLCQRLGPAGGRGLVAHFVGSLIETLTIEARFTLTNMAIEFGSRSALIVPDQQVVQYLRKACRFVDGDEWVAALQSWQDLSNDPHATFQQRHSLDVSQLEPLVTWGTSPHQSIEINSAVPDPNSMDVGEREAACRALEYMDLRPGQLMTDIPIHNVFIGSCTNGRLEDLRAAAAVLVGKRISPQVQQALVVPGSGRVKQRAEAEGLDTVFRDAGFAWREPGCSMCLGMNGDLVSPGQRCAATSNRNFVGRQGPGARTHLLSPAMAAAAAIKGRLTDVREML